MIKEKLLKLGYEYTPSTLQVLNFSFHSAVKCGDLVFTSGQIPMYGDTMIKGKVGNDVNIELAIKAAEICAFNCLKAAGAVVDIESIESVVKVFGMVNCSSDFNDTSKIINGSSDFFVKVFGEKGFHARSAVGMILPSDWAVEVEAIFKIKNS
jgi:enamine deaminase RidA (YjgF/YER057c/UK114 family)